MGITIHYRGTFNDGALIEEMEDRVIDVALALGGRATVWRSFSDLDPARAIRGVMLDMAPGQETMSLLVSPEGHLINLREIEDAERRPLTRPPDCFVKTQFGSEQGHIAIVFLLDALRERYFRNLTVTDESGFHEHRDPQLLSQKMKEVSKAIRGLTEALQHSGLSDEAAEDPNILASRIERVAQLVASRMRMAPDPSAAEQIRDEASDFEQASSLEEDVDAMERMHRASQLRIERMRRRIADVMAAGVSIEDAMDLALRLEGLGGPGLEHRDAYGSEERAEVGFFPLRPTANDHEPWVASLDSHAFGDASDVGPSGFDSDRAHPTVQLAHDLLLELIRLGDGAPQHDSFCSIATRGLIDVVGGLVQATSDRLDAHCDRALDIVQLRRALRGHAFCRGAIFGLRAHNRIDETTSRRFHTALAVLLQSIHELMAAAWDEGAR